MMFTSELEFARQNVQESTSTVNTYTAIKRKGLQKGVNFPLGGQLLGKEIRRVP